MVIHCQGSAGIEEVMIMEIHRRAPTVGAVRLGGDGYGDSWLGRGWVWWYGA